MIVYGMKSLMVGAVQSMEIRLHTNVQQQKGQRAIIAARKNPVGANNVVSESWQSMYILYAPFTHLKSMLMNS